jgi:hypothetical protein
MELFLLMLKTTTVTIIINHQCISGRRKQKSLLMETIRFLFHHSLSSCSTMWRDPLWTFPRRSQQLKPVIYLLLLWQICRSHCLRHLNSCSLLWFCLIYTICIFSFPPTSHKTHRKSFFILRKKQRLLMAVYVNWERKILISTYTIFIFIV